MAKILIHPHPILRQKAKPVTQFGQKLTQLANEMLKTIIPDPNDPQGVGLAANQIGVLQQIFIMRFPNQKIEVVINPKILKASSKMLSGLPEKNQYLEGCLSVPGYYAFVDRPVKIKVIYQTLTGSLKKKTLNYPYSAYFQHENDHLNGILFIDYVKKSKAQLYLIDPKTKKLKPVKNPFL